MQIEYCEKCERRCSEHDFQVGQAAWIRGEVYCKECMDKSGLKPPLRIVPVGRGKPGSSTSLKAVDNRIRKVPGSGKHPVARPPSGLRPTPKGSGIRRKGSGMRRKGSSGLRRRSPGSGLRRSPGSGLRLTTVPPAEKKATPRSGIRRAQNAGAFGSRVRQARRRSGSEARLPRPLSQLWIAVFGILAGLAVGVVIFLFTRPS